MMCLDQILPFPPFCFLSCFPSFPPNFMCSVFNVFFLGAFISFYIYEVCASDVGRGCQISWN